MIKKPDINPRYYSLVVDTIGEDVPEDAFRSLIDGIIEIFTRFYCETLTKELIENHILDVLNKKDKTLLVKYAHSGIRKYYTDNKNTINKSFEDWKLSRAELRMMRELL